MGGKSSKPVTGENGVITYKVDVYGANIRQKFDSGNLEISEDQVTFTGPKATFKWPIKELKRYGSAKKVFTIEINEHNEQLDSREIKFKTKYADSIYEQFKNKVGEMENEAKGEGGEEKKADAANAITDDAKAAEPEKTNGSVQKASDKDDAKTDNEGKESGKTSPNAAGMTLTTNPTITVQTPSPTTERAGSGPTTPAEGDKEEPEQTQETPEPAAAVEGETKETAASPEEKPSESPEPETKEAAPAETPEPEPVPEPEASEKQEDTPASQDVAPEPEAEPVTSEEPAPSAEEPAPSVEEPAPSVEEPVPSEEPASPEPVIEEPAAPAAENHTAQEPEDAEKTCSEEAATAVTNHDEETPADPPAAEEAPPADNQEAEAEPPAAENGPSESQDAE